MIFKHMIKNLIYIIIVLYINNKFSDNEFVWIELVIVWSRKVFINFNDLEKFWTIFFYVYNSHLVLIFEIFVKKDCLYIKFLLHQYICIYAIYKYAIYSLLI